MDLQLVPIYNWFIGCKTNTSLALKVLIRPMYKEVKDKNEETYAKSGRSIQRTSLLDLRRVRHFSLGVVQRDSWRTWRKVS